jgi:hypothetical protein
MRSVIDANTLRGQLATGELTAFQICDGHLVEIHRSEWIAESGEAMLECGYWVAGGFYHYTNGWFPKDRSAPAYPIVVQVRQALAEEGQPAKLPLRPKGKPAIKMNRIIAEMRGMDRTKLSDMNLKAMQHQFGAAASTCKKARDTALE